ncbi:MAG: sulfite exporter TauE/SafE family protein [Thermoleophilia bacterium]
MENANTLPKVSVYPLIGIGIVSGLFAAMFGIGGGVVIVPLLILLTRMPPRIAAATSLATLLLTSMIGTARYAGSGHIDWVAAIVIGVPAVVGVVIGISFQKRLPADWLIIAFGVLIIAIGLKLVFKL